MNLSWCADFFAWFSSLQLSLQDWSDIASIITGIVSLAIATWALRYSFKQTRANQEHNRITVKPHLEGVTHYSEDTERFTISIENNGLGPAYIVGFGCAVDKELCPDGIEPISWMAKKLIPEGRLKSARVDQVVGKTAMRPGSTLNLLSFASTDFESKRFMKQLHHRCDAGVFYTSAYGEKLTLQIAGNINVITLKPPSPLTRIKNRLTPLLKIKS